MKKIYILVLLLAVSLCAVAQNSPFRLSDLIGEHYTTIVGVMIERNGQMVGKETDNQNPNCYWVWYNYNSKSIGFKISNAYCSQLISLESIKRYEIVISNLNSDLNLRKVDNQSWVDDQRKLLFVVNPPKEATFGVIIGYYMQ